MNIPAIKGSLGTTIFYATNLMFKDLVQIVNCNRSDFAIETSTDKGDTFSLPFPNPIVLAIHGGCPTWNGIEVTYRGENYSNMGILQLEGTEDIFAKEGENKVNNIKRALAKHPKYGDETIAVIFIQHPNNIIL